MAIMGPAARSSRQVAWDRHVKVPAEELVVAVPGVEIGGQEPCGLRRAQAATALDASAPPPLRVGENAPHLRLGAQGIGLGEGEALRHPAADLDAGVADDGPPLVLLRPDG